MQASVAAAYMLSCSTAYGNLVLDQFFIAKRTTGEVPQMLFFKVCSLAQQPSPKPSGGAPTVLVDHVLPKQMYGYQGSKRDEGLTGRWGLTRSRV